MRICSACRIVKEEHQFYKSNGRINSKCKFCVKEYTAKYKEENAGHLGNYQRSYLSDPKARAKFLFAKARLRAKASNIEFSLSLERVTKLIEIGICERTGWKLDLSTPRGKYHRNPLSPSLDKKDPFGGYTDENTQLVCNAYNMGKGQSDDNEFFNLCYAVVIRNTQMK